ncbi:tRNA (N(6)-L-threonylcarbamoyladenosine(37)-C(2))-methylthiotransferase [Methanopyrus sp.]
MIKVAVEVYGCAANHDDGRLVRELLRREGFEVVNDPENADVAVLLTCIVRDSVDARMVNRMRELKRVPTVVAGCFPEAYPERVRKLRPDAALVGPRHLDRVPEAVRAVLRGNRTEFLGEREDIDWKADAPRELPNLAAIVPIAEGCPNRCAYCAVKLARGNLCSFPPERILRRVKRELERGAVEIHLTAQDTAAYGLDRGTNVVELLEEVVDLCSRYGARVRLGMFNPGHAYPIVDDLADLFASRDDVLYRSIHMPVQSGDDEVLRRMSRNYTVEEALEVYHAFERRLGYFSFITDVIVGFPGETEEAFRNTLGFLERTRPHILHASRFCRRPGTPAARMKDQVPEDVKLRRSRVLHRKRLEWAEEANRELIGETVEVTMVMEGWGRDEHAKKTVFRGEVPEPGERLECRIVDASHARLVAEV